jgi:hypothetical protein
MRSSASEDVDERKLEIGAVYRLRGPPVVNVQVVFDKPTMEMG